MHAHWGAMNATAPHPFHREIGEVEAALARGSCAQALAERITRLQTWLDAEAEAGGLPDGLHTVLTRHVEDLRRAVGTHEPELTLAALANLDEAASLLHGTAHGSETHA